MNETKKAAYRHLLYVAMLAIRGVGQSRTGPTFNPINWYRNYHQSRVAGATADWLHNLARFSSVEFNEFNEEQFWREHVYLCKRFPKAGFERYREIFDLYLAGKVFVC